MSPRKNKTSIHVDAIGGDLAKMLDVKRRFIETGPVKKIGAMGAALEFGEEPKRRALPSGPALRLDTL
jgi:hypothetical protein